MNRFEGLDLIQCLKNYERRLITLYRSQWPKPSHWRDSPEQMISWPVPFIQGAGAPGLHQPLLICPGLTHKTSPQRRTPKAGIRCGLASFWLHHGVWRDYRIFKSRVLAGLGDGFVSPECLFLGICVRRILKSSNNPHLSVSLRPW